MLTEQAIKFTTQLKQQDTDGPILRNFSMNDQMLQYKQINTHFFTATLVTTNYEAEVNFRAAIGSTSSHCSKEVYLDSLFELSDMDLGKNY